MPEIACVGRSSDDGDGEDEEEVLLPRISHREMTDQPENTSSGRYGTWAPPVERERRGGGEGRTKGSKGALTKDR